MSDDIQLITHKQKEKAHRRAMAIRIDDEYYHKLETIGKKNQLTPNKLAEIGIIEFVDAIYDTETKQSEPIQEE